MSFLLAFLGFAVLIILHEAGHFGAAKAVGMRVERFSLFFPPLLARRRVGDTEYAVGAIPLGGYVKITGMNPHEELEPAIAHRAYYRQPVWKRVVVIAAGPLVNIVLAFVMLWVLFMVTHPGVATPKVEQVSSDMPAAAIFAPGDRIVAVDGKRGEPADFQRAISAHACAGTPTQGCAAKEPAQVTFLHDGREITKTVTPRYDADAGRPIIGFSFGQRPGPRPGPVAAAGNSVHEMWYVTTRTVSAIAQIFKPEERKQLSGVVGSYERTRRSFEISTTGAIYLLAVISLSLGVINLFPFLPLDGGHIFWAVAEKLRGRAIPVAVMERAGFIGFALVITLFVIGFTNDIGRLTGEGFGVR